MYLVGWGPPATLTLASFPVHGGVWPGYEATLTPALPPQIEKVEDFKTTLDRGAALHAKYNMSELESCLRVRVAIL